MSYATPKKKREEGAEIEKERNRLMPLLVKKFKYFFVICHHHYSIRTFQRKSLEDDKKREFNKKEQRCNFIYSFNQIILLSCAQKLVHDLSPFNYKYLGWN